ncbi:hypothetical protein DAI22_06g269803 [Oryza sativa Japonica Group]|nr:hypothetical protein DAI22_06g269803 [Oryza sativa Japonica Group]
MFRDSEVAATVGLINKKAKLVIKGRNISRVSQLTSMTMQENEPPRFLQIALKLIKIGWVICTNSVLFLDNCTNLVLDT